MRRSQGICCSHERHATSLLPRSGLGATGSAILYSGVFASSAPKRHAHHSCMHYSLLLGRGWLFDRVCISTVHTILFYSSGASLLGSPSTGGSSPSDSVLGLDQPSDGRNRQERTMFETREGASGEPKLTPTTTNCHPIIGHFMPPNFHRMIRSGPPWPPV